MEVPLVRRLLVLPVLTLLLACPGKEDDTATTTPLAEICGNDVDDDGDTYADCTDPDCYTDPTCIRTEDQCTNGADDDGDKRMDCDDPDCAADPACEGQEADCQNELDDDDDSYIDCDDKDCYDDPFCRDTTSR